MRFAVDNNVTSLIMKTSVSYKKLEALIKLWVKKGISTSPFSKHSVVFKNMTQLAMVSA